MGHPAVARRRPPRRFLLVRLAPLAIAITIALGACDGSRTQASPPLDPPVRSGEGGGACSQTDVDGAAVVRFETDGSCLPGDVLVLYRCAPGAVPILRISSVAGPALFLGGVFAVPVKTLPAHVRFAGRGPGTEILIADPLAPSPSPGASISASPSAEGVPAPDPEPLVYVRHDGLTERWLRLEGRRTRNDPPIVWLIGDSIMDGGRDPLEARLGDWNFTLDAEVGRSSSSGAALAQEAAAQGSDAVVVELGTNDSSSAAFRGDLIETLNGLASVPFVIWQTAKGPEDATNIPAVNATIREVVPTYPNVAIADWEVFVPAEALQEDGIHPGEGFEHLESDLLLPMLSEWRATLSTEGATSCGREVVRETS
jgi:hypothetical protein